MKNFNMKSQETLRARIIVIEGRENKRPLEEVIDVMIDRGISEEVMQQVLFNEWP
jgi:hypothetical protein